MSRPPRKLIEAKKRLKKGLMQQLLTGRMRLHGELEENINEILNKRIRNGFQNPKRAEKNVRDHMSVELFKSIASDTIKRLSNTFEKRNPITHNLGIIDRKYIETIRNAEREGKEIRVTKQEIIDAIDIILNVLSNLHSQLFISNESGK